MFYKKIKLFVAIVLIGASTNVCHSAALPTTELPSISFDTVKSLVLMLVGKEYKRVNLDSVQEDFKIFFGIGAISSLLTPEYYLKRLITYLHACPECFVCASIYMLKIFKKAPDLCNSISFYRLSLAALVIAIKYLQDNYYSMSYYAGIGGIDVNELGNLELRVLQLLDYDISISREYWQGFTDSIFKLYSLENLFGNTIVRIHIEDAKKKQDYIDGVIDFVYVFNVVQHDNPRKYMFSCCDVDKVGVNLIIRPLTFEESKNIADENVRAKILQEMYAELE
ncbi:MAG: hypothetical protein US49_C0001G0176 [candidate division TM6 bacterium GW2011_GWF2_37_49]|nr:MAG: hypothetical protein US49_C0001G0176 [candidate division TM6 bacterium GW2011_GWF2_37_49]